MLRIQVAPYSTTCMEAEEKVAFIHAMSDRMGGSKAEFSGFTLPRFLVSRARLGNGYIQTDGRLRWPRRAISVCRSGFLAALCAFSYPDCWLFCFFYTAICDSGKKTRVWMTVKRHSLLCQQIASFPGSHAWAEGKKCGTHCLRKLGSPGISGNLEISVKSVLLHCETCLI